MTVSASPVQVLVRLTPAPNRRFQVLNVSPPPLGCRCPSGVSPPLTDPSGVMEGNVALAYPWRHVPLARASPHRLRSVNLAIAMAGEANACRCRLRYL